MFERQYCVYIMTNTHHTVLYTGVTYHLNKGGKVGCILRASPAKYTPHPFFLRGYGVTNNLHRRMLEHRSGNGSVFTKRYNVTKLVYFECFDDVKLAIFREKQIKAGSRQKKIDLVNSLNPEWKDLYKELFD